MINELCDSVSLCEMTEFSSRRLSKNVQSLSILDILGWNEESMQQRQSFML
jgi:hypothetical protein